MFKKNREPLKQFFGGANRTAEARDHFSILFRLHPHSLCSDIADVTRRELMIRSHRFRVLNFIN